MDFAADMDLEAPLTPDVPNTGTTDKEQESSTADRQLVSRITRTIRADKKHHENAFKIMKRDMFVAKHGRSPDWSEKNYKANIAGRHVKQKTDALYAKNPKAVARRPPPLDFAIWDETVESLQIAMMTMQQAAQVQAMAAATPPALAPMTGALGPVQPQLPPGFAEPQGIGRAPA